uniref:Uncharacterized protein n=1 Tax=Arundo donax TaxID=35708 RepID=A0A0A9BYF3_ARUDO
MGDGAAAELLAVAERSVPPLGEHLEPAQPRLLAQRHRLHHPDPHLPAVRAHDAVLHASTSSTGAGPLGHAAT